jgi:hypothetical protein
MADRHRAKWRCNGTVKLFKMGQRFRKEIIKDFIKFKIEKV